MTAAATIALAPLPTDPVPATQAVPVALTGAWQTLQANVQSDVANLVSLVVNYPPAPILTQVAKNFTTYSHWLVGQDGGTPLKIVKTMGDHAAAVLGVIGTLGVMAPLSLIGAFIAPGVMIVQLIADTAKYPSTPQTVLQAFIDAPAVFLNTAFNCCSTPLFQLAFGLLNPGPLGYLLSIGPSIAKALQITPPAESPQPAAASAPKQSAPSAAASPAEAASPAVGQSRRSQPVTGARQTVGPSGGKRPSATRTSADSSARKVASDGKGQSARPGNRETR